MLDSADIAVVDFAGADIDGFLRYWYDADAGFLAAMGVDPAKLPSRRKMREMLELNLERDERSRTPQNTILSIKLKGETIGVHELTHLTAGDSGILHAHIWDRAHRGRGIGIVSYVKAMQVFFRRFDLARIVFESPAHNPGANRIKDKLGIEASGEGMIDLPILRHPVATVRYVVAAGDMPAIVRNMERAWLERGYAIDGRGAQPAAHGDTA
ncbi:MAG TPA: GNAT family protein [Arenibaculum sp.]|nr:GNAT family protein [Arenibaculum sp.]